MALYFRQCDSTDLDSLVQLSKITFSDAFEKDNDPHDFRTYLQEAFGSKQLAKELSNKNTFFYFVYDGQELVGYFKLNVESAQSDVQDPKALEIERIYVLNEHQGKKIGSRMLKRITEKAKEMHKQYIWLGVWEHNPKAIRFYQNHGFVKFGEHPYFIGTDEQTDWLLRLEIQ
ncbi:N-acetyltransferase [Flagellimonas marinaquae]|uniref:N-acetyltransferase n=1 Tax=Flagellimonas marinaquae TaxID=254955 RepID=A0AA48HDN4_9FLAO|nr:N-acetyltransferase [Allomuricauda aquimarina]